MSDLWLDISAWRASCAAKEISANAGKQQSTERIKMLAQLSQISMDSETAARVQRLLQEEVRKIDPKWQQEEQWKATKALIVIGVAIGFLALLGSLASPATTRNGSSNYVAPEPTPAMTPEASPIEVRRATLVPRSTPYVSDYVARLLNSTPQATPTMTPETSPVEVRRATLVHRHHRVNER
jgi:hypothetical protein